MSGTVDTGPVGSSLPQLNIIAVITAAEKTAIALLNMENLLE
jgi:hypothetical protein